MHQPPLPLHRMRYCSSPTIHHQIVGILTRSGSQHARHVALHCCTTHRIDGKPSVHMLMHSSTVNSIFYWNGCREKVENRNENGTEGTKVGLSRK